MLSGTEAFQRKLAYQLVYTIASLGKINFSCEKVHHNISNFLTSADIKVFGHTYPFTMLLLIGLRLFLHPGNGVFCLAYHYFLEGVITSKQQRSKLNFEA